jgi:hypothetical protein
MAKRTHKTKTHKLGGKRHKLTVAGAHLGGHMGKKTGKKASKRSAKKVR